MHMHTHIGIHIQIYITYTHVVNVSTCIYAYEYMYLYVYILMYVYMYILIEKLHPKLQAAEEDLHMTLHQSAPQVASGSVRSISLPAAVSSACESTGK